MTAKEIFGFTNAGTWFEGKAAKAAQRFGPARPAHAIPEQVSGQCCGNRKASRDRKINPTSPGERPNRQQ
jgi:hypothetical protein